MSDRKRTAKEAGVFRDCNPVKQSKINTVQEIKEETKVNKITHPITTPDKRYKFYRPITTHLF